jgi:organic hydroperoxide reductase OsmC/OhrA
MRHTFPHRYMSTITRVGHSIATIDAPPRAPLSGGPPPELNGDPRAWSPEHLLVSALGLCLFATFESFAAREHIVVYDWRDAVSGVVDRTPSGLEFRSFTIDVEVTVAPADIERTREVLDRARRYCVISKALAVPVKIESHVWSHDERAHHESTSV